MAVTGVYLMLHLWLGSPWSNVPSSNREFRLRIKAYTDESYLDFLARLVGERSLGRSFFSLQPVDDLILDAAGMSISLLRLVSALVRNAGRRGSAATNTPADAPA